MHFSRFAGIALIGLIHFPTAQGQQYFNPQPTTAWEVYGTPGESGQYITRSQSGGIFALTAIGSSSGSRLICFDENDGTLLWDVLLSTSGKPNGLSVVADTAIVAMVSTSGILELWSYNFNGALLWHEEYSDLGQATGMGHLTVDTSSNIVLAAQIVGLGGYEDILVLKTSSTGAEIWHQVFDGPAHRDERALAIHIDSDENVVIAGYIWNNAFEEEDHLVVKYDSNGNWQWTWETEISDNDRICSLASNSFGDIFFSGYVHTGGFIGQLSPGGTLQWSDIFPGAIGPYNEHAPLTMDADGGLLTIWDFSNSPQLVSYTQNGSFQWSSRSVGKPRDLLVRPDGTIIQCGKFVNGMFIQANRSNGIRLWEYPPYLSTGGSYASGSWRSVILPDGDIVTTGNLYNNSGAYTVRICSPNVLRCMSMATSRNVPVGEQMIAGNFNNDAYTDLLVGGLYPGSVTVALGTDSGDFIPGAVLSSALSWDCMDAYRSGIGNLDGVLCYYTDMYDPTRIQWFVPNGDGTFDAQPILDFGQEYRRIRIADIDNDGDDDLALSFLDNGNITIQFLRNNGVGDFINDSVISMPNGLRDFELSDMDNDGFVDLICMHTNTVAIYPGDGSGAFGTPGIHQISSGYLINAGDIDLDGLKDLLISNISSVSTWMNTGVSFEQGPTYATQWGQFISDVTTNPFGDDGSILFVLDRSPVYFYPNDSCTGAAIHNGPLQGGATVVADLNNDGLMDFCVKNGMYDNGMLCYYNCGPANGAPPGTAHVASSPKVIRNCPNMSFSRDNQLNLHWDGPPETIRQIEVLNLQGIRTSAARSSGTELNLSGLASGMYIVHVITPKWSCSKRIAKL